MTFRDPFIHTNQKRDMRTQPWYGQAKQISDTCLSSLPGLVGVYVHGSAALGGFGHASDLDVLVITNGGTNWLELGNRLLAISTSQQYAVELSVVDHQAAIQVTEPCEYHLHVNSAQSRFGSGAGRADPDLLAHYAVAKQSGIPIYGPDPGLVIGEVSRDSLLEYLKVELREGAEFGDQRYAVLNACRAVAFAAEGILLSKVEGGLWWTQKHGDNELVSNALAAQRDGSALGSSSSEARIFVESSIHLLEGS